MKHDTPYYYTRMEMTNNQLTDEPAVIKMGLEAAKSLPAGSNRWGDVLGNGLKQLGTTLMEASNIALDRSRWRSTYGALVSE